MWMLYNIQVLWEPCSIFRTVTSKKGVVPQHTFVEMPPMCHPRVTHVSPWEILLYLGNNSGVSMWLPHVSAQLRLVPSSLLYLATAWWWSPSPGQGESVNLCQQLLSLRSSSKLRSTALNIFNRVLTSERKIKKTKNEERKQWILQQNSGSSTNSPLRC